jgi:hypothetical protein
LLQFAMQDIGQLTYLGLVLSACLPRTTHGTRRADRKRLQGPAATGKGPRHVLADANGDPYRNLIGSRGARAPQRPACLYMI